MNKRILSLALAVVTAAAALTGCGTGGDKTKNIATFSGGEIPAGVYIYNQINTMNQYSYYFGTEGLLEQKIGETTVKDIVNETAAENIKRYAAVESEFARLGLTMNEAASKQLLAEVDRAWQSESELLQAKGISLESVRKIALSNLKTLEVFKAYYQTGGEFAVSEEQLKAYYKENFRRAMLIQIPKYDDNGILTGEALDKVKAEIEGYFERAKNGEPLFDLLKEYAKSQGQEIDPAAKEEQYQAVISKSGSGFPTLFVETLFGPELKKGEPKKYDNGDLEIIYELRDLDESGLFFEQNKDNILYQMKNAEFAEKLIAVSEQINFAFNEEALKRYTPEELLKR